MRFDLRKPCPQCPFRQGQTFLHPKRAEEIALAVAKDNKTFTCHKTLDQREIDQQMCAGAAAFVRKLNAPNQMLQIAERLGLLDPDQLLADADAEVYDSVDAMTEAHRNGR